MRQSTSKITLRMPNNTLQELEKESGEKDLPLSSIAIKTLNKHASLERRFEVISTMTLWQEEMEMIIEDIEESTMARVAKIAPQKVKKVASLAGFEYNLDSLIENYFSTVGKYCGWYQFKHKIDRVNYTLVFETAMGRKWTRFVSQYVRSILESLKVHLGDELVTDNVITFQLVKL